LLLGIRYQKYVEPQVRKTNNDLWFMTV